MRFVINTPNGHIGRAVAKHLLAAGHQVVGVHRSPDKINDLVELGLQVVEGSLDDANALGTAFEGADGLMWLTPVALRPDYMDWAKSAVELAANVAAQSGIVRVVNLSSGGAQHRGVNGPVGISTRWRPSGTAHRRTSSTCGRVSFSRTSSRTFRRSLAWARSSNPFQATSAFR